MPRGVVGCEMPGIFFVPAKKGNINGPSYVKCVISGLFYA